MTDVFPHLEGHEIAKNKGQGQGQGQGSEATTSFIKQNSTKSAILKEQLIQRIRAKSNPNRLKIPEGTSEAEKMLLAGNSNNAVTRTSSEKGAKVRRLLSGCHSRTGSGNSADYATGNERHPLSRRSLNRKSANGIAGTSFSSEFRNSFEETSKNCNK